jgi:hypothetical protein
MSERLRIRVLRLRQLSIRGLYDRLQKPCNLDVTRLGEERREAPPRVCQLTASALWLTVLETPTGRSEVPQPRYQLVVPEARRVRQRPRGLAVLAAQHVPLDTPEDPLQASARRRPLLGCRVVLHGHDRA